jgi:hypothetical protein
VNRGICVGNIVFLSSINRKVEFDSLLQCFGSMHSLEDKDFHHFTDSEAEAHTVVTHKTGGPRKVLFLKSDP